MASTSSVASSGIDVAGLVSQLMAAERRPIDKLEAKVYSYDAKISSYGTISSLVSTFRSSMQTLESKLEGFSATSSDETAVSASADSTAVEGSYALNVTQLAKAQTLVAAGQASKTSAIGTGTATVVTFDFGTINGVGFDSGTGKYGAGTTFTSGGTTANITIDSSNNTLEGIRDAINSADMGVTATVINDGSGTPYRLVLTSDSTGASNSIKITTDGADATIDALLSHDPAGTQNLEERVTAQNAQFTVNGIDITSGTNTISDAIQGVTLTLKTASTSTVTVQRDMSAITDAVSEFVDSYNELATKLKEFSAYATDDSKGGDLAGDGTVRLMQEQLRSIFNAETTGGTLSMLAEVGVSFQSDGKLQLDSGSLSTALSSDYADVANLFSGATGFTTRLEAWADDVLASGEGLLAQRTATLNDYIDSYNEQIERLELQMAALQKRYTATFTNLNMLLTNMNATGGYLTQQFSGGTG